MKLSSSLGFLSLGVLMFFLPRLAPSVSPTDFFGVSIRATWLHFMGLVQIAIGGSYLLRKAGSEMAAWLERWPELLSTGAPPELDPEPQGALRPVAQPLPLARPLAPVIAVDFRPALVDQRRAA